MQIIDRGGRWWVFGYVVDTDGKRQRVRKSTGIRNTGQPSYKLAEERAPDILRRSQLEASGLVAPEARTTLGGALTALIRRLTTGGRAQATIEIALLKADPVLAYFGRDRKIGTITAAQLSSYAAHRLGLPRKASTVHRELRTLRDAIKAAGLTPPTIPDLGRFPARERALDPDEQRKLVIALPGFRRDYVVLYLHLGLTLSEIRRFGPRDIDWEGGDFGQVYVRGTKAESRRRILPLTPEAREVLERRCAETTEGEPLFPEWPNIQRDLKRACARAGIANATPNDLRRSFATEHAKAGTPILVLMHMMGHTSTRMLEQVYARVGRGQHLHDAARNLPTLSPSARAKYVPDTKAKSASSDRERGDE